MSADLTIIIPAYCEAQALPVVLPAVLDYCCERGWQIIVVDDGSTDDTHRILQSYQNHSLLKIYRHKLNRGYGAAIKTGLLHTQTRYAVTFDADGQHLLQSLDPMLEVIRSQNADLVIGRRQWLHSPGLYRSLGKWIIRGFARLLVPNQIEDLNSGCKMYNRTEVRRYLPFCPNSMAFSDVISLVMISRGCLVLEYPIQVEQRRSGRSTINTWTALETILEILHAMVLLHPMRFFLPLSVISILAGILWGIPILLAKRGVSVGSMLAIASGLIFFAIGLLSEQISQLRMQQSERDDATTASDEPDECQEA